MAENVNHSEKEQHSESHTYTRNTSLFSPSTSSHNNYAPIPTSSNYTEPDYSTNVLETIGDRNLLTARNQIQRYDGYNATYSSFFVPNVCFLCKRKKATQGCVYCQINVCCDCYYKFTCRLNYHPIVDLNHNADYNKEQADRSLKENEEYCEVHNLFARFYCETCIRVICPVCVIYNHVGHDHINLLKAYKKYRRELRETITSNKIRISKIESVENDVLFLLIGMDTYLFSVKENIEHIMNSLYVNVKENFKLVADQAYSTEIEQLNSLITECKLRGKEWRLPITADCCYIRLIKFMQKVHFKLKLKKEYRHIFKDILKRLFRVSEEPLEELLPPRDECQHLFDEPFEMMYSINILPSCFSSQSSRDIQVNSDEMHGFNYLKPKSVYSTYTPIRCFAKAGKEDGQLLRPWGLCVDKRGKIIISDRRNNRIQVFDNNGTYLDKFGEEGSEPGQFKRPCGITIDGCDRIIVADKDNNRIQIFNINGLFILQFGSKGKSVGCFESPMDVAVDNHDNIVVTDSLNERIQLFNSMGKFINQYKFIKPSYLNKSIKCILPRGVCFINGCDLLVTDFNFHRLMHIDSNFLQCTSYSKFVSYDNALDRPSGITVDDRGYIYVVDSKNKRILVYEQGLRPYKEIEFNGLFTSNRPCNLAVTPERILIVLFEMVAEGRSVATRSIDYLVGVYTLDNIL